MRLVKLLLAAVLAGLALTVGIVVVAALTVLGLGIYFFLRIRGARRGAGRSPGFPQPARRDRAPSNGEIIEVEATEVPGRGPGS